MTALNIETPVAEFVTRRPRNAHILEKLGVDFCCGGSRTLRQACAEAGLDAGDVLRQLTAEGEGDQDGSPNADQGGRPNADQDGRPKDGPGAEPRWDQLKLSALADEIVKTHHAYLRAELPRLSELLGKVARRHGGGHPELATLQALFARFAAEMNSHMFKEEMILFPAVRRIESGSSEGLPCGSLDGPIFQMEREHDEAGEALREMRGLTRGYAPPADACDSYRALLQGLERLEADMHLHIHKENNVLFPRALEAEDLLAR